MADAWSGEILLPDSNSSINDISLAPQHGASTSTPAPAIPAGALRFLAAVDTARIPLYLAAGPSLDVWTSNPATEAWFQSTLLSKPAATNGAAGPGDALAWWTCARAQAPIGILAQIEHQQEKSCSPRITEILFYGTIASPSPSNLPTPPSSSPDRPHDQQDDPLPELRVHALPISSDLLYTLPSPEVPPSPATSTPEPQFLPPYYDLKPASCPPKRKRDVFEEATIARKKARGKGGEGIAAAAARANESQRPFTHTKSASVDAKPSPFQDGRPNSAHGSLSRPPSRKLSRSPSLSDPRPLSRKGPPESQTKRSHLSQVATVPLQPEEPTTETRNKEALSKIVMAAMRMHGLQQSKKVRSRRNSAPSAELSEHLSKEAAAEEAAKDEEYKLIYHQTYKGAALALRKHLSIKPLHLQPDRLRNVVEQLLAIFLSDPLDQSPSLEDSTKAVSTPGNKAQLAVPGSNHSQASPFDLPSNAGYFSVKKPAHSARIQTGSPIRKKQIADSETQPA